MHQPLEVVFTDAVMSDLPEIIALLADDQLGSTRESTSNVIDPGYFTAFNEILADPNNDLVIGKLEGKVVAVLQVTYIPNLTLKGSKRAQIEGVRVSSSLRGQGIGRKLFAFTLARAKSRGCRLVQLTTNKSRPEAYLFYESLNFKPTHEGFKLEL